MIQQLLQQQDEIHQLQTEMATKEQQIQVEIQLLQNEAATKAQEMQTDMQQLQDEMVAKDQRIQALEQRDYIERSCNGGYVLATNPYNVLASGSGYNYQTANFSRAFRTTPVVTIGLTVLDHAHFVTLRVQTDVTEISTTGLTVRFGAWEDAKLYYARLYWLACA
ncbi:Hypp7285 [Branchiostoma lanceolatum]|uniref:Hypp7285 protein n=1 Tax=Branchiostoma lanceolatum TaxID=7740 RepID=A0A8J9YYT1_BRALA|nr:Hypp7285 [Branchiostoma lanceolatum]